MKKAGKLLINVLTLLAFVVVLANCGGTDSGGDGGSGVCVVQSALGTTYNFCESNYDQSECNRLSNSTFYASSCSSLGYTLHCSGDGPNVTRKHCP